MRRKTLLAIGAVVLGLVCAVIGLGLMLTHKPRFYKAAAIEPGPLRTKQSKAFASSVSLLFNGIRNQEEKWGARFTTTQINSYLAEGFIEQGVAALTLPKGVSQPRVAIEDDRIRLGFSYGKAPWSTVICVDLRVWLAPKDTNVVVLQLDGVYAGAVPISSKLVKDTVTKVILSQNHSTEVTWYRHEGKLTALLRLGGSRPRPVHQLQQLKVGQGMLVVQGRSVQDTPPQVSTQVSTTSPSE